MAGMDEHGGGPHPLLHLVRRHRAVEGRLDAKPCGLGGRLSGALADDVQRHTEAGEGGHGLVGALRIHQSAHEESAW